MPARTRSTTSSPVKKSQVVVPMTTFQDEYDPVKLLIAPANLATTAKIISLRHPRDGLSAKYLFCPNSGLHELKQTRAAAPEPRSTIFAPQSNSVTNSTHSPDDETFGAGFVNKDSEILTATPYDLAFILLRVIAPRTINGNKSPFQPLEDLLETPESDDRGLAVILKEGQDFIQSAMTKICDVFEAGGENMYRYNEEKVYDWLIDKARNVVKSGIPTSLEERFVTRVLEAPMLTVRREDTTISTAPAPTDNEESKSQNNSFDSESITSTTVSAVFSQKSTTTTVITEVEDDVPAHILHLQRLRTAFNFINMTCVPPYVTSRFTSLSSSQTSSIDFGPLEEYLKRLAVLRAEAISTRSLSDFSKKRSLDEEEAAEDRAEKKRKQDEEEKRKRANESRGVRDLKKVNVSGMKKMSDFFGKKPATAKAKS